MLCADPAHGLEPVTQGATSTMEPQVTEKLVEPRNQLFLIAQRVPLGHGLEKRRLEQILGIGPIAQSALEKLEESRLAPDEGLHAVAYHFMVHGRAPSSKKLPQPAGL